MEGMDEGRRLLILKIRKKERKKDDRSVKGS